MSPINPLPVRRSEFERQLAAMLLPDYLVRENDVAPDESAAALVAVGSVISKLQDRANLAWAGARIALLLIENPWLASCKITIRCSSEYNDQGGTYLSRWLSVSDVKALPAAQVPEAFRIQNGLLDEDTAANELENELADDVTGFADAFMEPYEDSEHEVLVDRTRIADLFAFGTPVSGAAVAERLWPDYKYLLAGSAKATDQPTATA